MNITMGKIIGLSALLLAWAANGAVDKVLTGKHGMTLYTFDKDTQSKSACLNSCAMTWPPAEAEATSSAEDYGSLLRADGFKQLTFRGKPVYLFSGDQKPGQLNGDNMGGVWHVIRETPITAQGKSNPDWDYGSSYSY